MDHRVNVTLLIFTYSEMSFFVLGLTEIGHCNAITTQAYFNNCNYVRKLNIRGNHKSIDVLKDKGNAYK